MPPGATLRVDPFGSLVIPYRERSCRWRHVDAQVDPITTEIIRSAFTAAADEMNATLIRSAYTPVIYEMKDCSVALLDAEHHVLGQSAGLPIFLGNLEICTRLTEEMYGRDAWQPGDVWIMNDSYLTGTHLNDMTVFGPIFHDGELVGFAASRAHWLDVGAKDPGGPMDSTEIYQEGIRLGPIKVVEGGVQRPDVTDLLGRNSRFSYPAIGDLGAQIACAAPGRSAWRDHRPLRTGDDRGGAGRDLRPDRAPRARGRRGDPGRRLPRRGLPRRRRHLDRAVLGAALRRDPRRRDDDRPLRDGRLQGRSGQLRRGAGDLRLPRRLQAPDQPGQPAQRRRLPAADRPRPPGSMLGAQAPAPCQWYFSPLGLLIDLVVKALSDVLPEQAAGASYGDSMVISLSGIDHRNGRPLLDLEPTVGGWGAWDGSDGEDGLINNVNGSLKDLPIEVLETKYPMRMTHYGFRPDTGGPGRWRGGNGVIREYTLDGEEATLSLWFERSRTPAWGLFGGRDATPPDVVINPGREDERRMLKCSRVRCGAATWCAP